MVDSKNCASSSHSRGARGRYHGGLRGGVGRGRGERCRGGGGGRGEGPDARAFRAPLARARAPAQENTRARRLGDRARSRLGPGGAGQGGDLRRSEAGVRRGGRGQRRRTRRGRLREGIQAPRPRASGRARGAEARAIRGAFGFLRGRGERERGRRRGTSRRERRRGEAGGRFSVRGPRAGGGGGRAHAPPVRHHGHQRGGHRGLGRVLDARHVDGEGDARQSARVATAQPLRAAAREPTRRLRQANQAQRPGHEDHARFESGPVRHRVSRRFGSSVVARRHEREARDAAKEGERRRRFSERRGGVTDHGATRGGVLRQEPARVRPESLDGDGRLPRV